MTTTKHTPGPWVVDHSFDILAEGTYEQGGWRVAEVRKFDEREESHANARLIAAAPELLAALRELVQFVNCASAVELEQPNKCAAYQSARAAIAKAESAS